MNNSPLNDKLQDDSFEGVIDRVKAYLGVKHDLDVAQVLKLSKTAFAERKRRESVPDDKIALFCNKESISMNWVLTGIGWSYKPENPKVAYEWIKKQFEKPVPIHTIVIVTYQAEGFGYEKGLLLLRKDIPAVISMEGRNIRSGYKGAGPSFYAETLKFIQAKNPERIGHINLGSVEPVYFEDVNFTSLFGDKTEFNNLIVDNELKALEGTVPTEPELKKGAFDANLMKEIIETVEEIFQKEQLYLPPKKKSELITLLYEELSEDRSKISSLPRRVLKLVKLAS